VPDGEDGELVEQMVDHALVLRGVAGDGPRSAGALAEKLGLRAGQVHRNVFCGVRVLQGWVHVASGLFPEDDDWKWDHRRWWHLGARAARRFYRNTTR